MFGFMDMAFDYKERKVENTEVNDAVIDTARVNDSTRPFETGIKHPSFNGGDWVIVELYDDKESAQAGHQRWVDTFTDKVPAMLKDVSTSEIKRFGIAVGAMDEEEGFVNQD